MRVGLSMLFFPEDAPKKVGGDEDEHHPHDDCDDDDVDALDNGRGPVLGRDGLLGDHMDLTLGEMAAGSGVALSACGGEVFLVDGGFRV